MKNLLWGLFAFATLAHAQGTITDIDGNTYDYLTYGTQQWTVENAAMETYRDGTPIPQVTDATQWSNLTTGAWCYYDNDPTKGKLYNWYAVAGIHDNDPNTPNKEFAPLGWHVPTDAEWTTLEEHLIANGYNYDGTTTGNKIAKAIASTTGWNSSTYTGAIGNDQSLNNSSGFNAFPEGSLYDGGSFFFDHDNAFFWSSIEGDSNNAWSRVLSTNTSNLFRSNYNKDYGFSVRFVQNSNTCSEASINASATEVCVGEEVTLNVNNLSTGTTQSCYGSTNQIFADWTELAPNAEYVNIIKHNDIYYLRSNNDVLQSDNINGSWVSMNFQNQIGHQCSPIATLFDFDWADRLQVATLHNSLYAYENGNWINNGLSGYGCSGRALTRLANNRIIVSKWGYLRDLYISDDNGSNWTNVTNVNNDYRDIIVADNGTVFACGGSNTASMTGLIKSTDNGNSFFNISSELGINYASTLSDDCEGNLYVLAENNIYKSTDEGENWTLFSNTPFNSTVTYSFLLPISSDVLFLFGRNANEIGLYESNNGGATWHELTNPLSDLNTIRELKLIDNVLVILSDEGVFGKTVEFSTTTYLWSTGDTTENITVIPTETTEYWVDVTTNGVTCREYITIDVTAPAAPTGPLTQSFCDTATIADLTATGDNIQWYDAATGGNLLDSTTALTDGQTVNASQTVNGCESTDRLEVTVSIQDITITATATEVCAGESVDLTVSYGLIAGTTACTSADLPANLQTGLVGYWPFCGNANDESGNGNNGTVNGATLTTDRFGNQDSAYIFEINDSFINIGSDNLLQFSNDFSYSVKFLVNEITLGSDCTAGSNIILNNEGLYEIGVDCNGILSFAIANDDPSWSWIPITPILINQWYDVTFTYNQGVIEIFMDGDLIYNYNGSGGLTDFHPNLNDLRLGDRQLHDVLNVQTSSFNGKIDDVVLWNRALSPSEIQQLASSSTYTWSTGDTTETISVTPTETTEYWVDVTTNGVTCREYVTINVSAPAAPTGDAQQTFCDTATVADLTVTGDNIQWYDAATGGNLLDSTTALTDGQMVYASQTVNGCESTDRLEVTVSVQDITITASATEVCAGDSVDLGVTYPQQFNSWTHMVAVYNLDTDLLYFYINGVLRATSDISGIGNIYLTGGGSGSRKIGARAYSNQPDIYFWGDIDDVGVWDKPLSDIQVTDLYENQNICQVMDLPLELQSDLIAYYPFCNSLVDIGGGHNGTNFGATASTDRFGNLNSSFHFDGTSHVSIPTSLNLNNTSGGWTLSAWANPDFIANNIPNANYILDLTDGTANNNWGDRTALGLVVDGYRTGSHADNNISTSYGVTAPFATPPSILWSTGDTTENITVTPTETTEYWVDVTTNGVTCREYVTITVNDLPEAPTGEIVNYFINCDSFSPTLNDAIATLTGDNIKLYDAAVGGNLLDPNSNIIDGQVVYASQTLDSCESFDRLEVQLNLYTLDTPTTDAPNNTVSFCNEQNLTLLDLGPAQTASEKLWYETATSTIPIPETTPLVDGVTYYVSNYDIETGCESDRLAMTVEINNPEAPTGDAVQSFCDNVTVSDLSASGSNIQWFDAATGGNVLDSSSALADGQVLYASQTENSCESVTRLEVSVEIDIIPDPILITTELEFCLAREATLADLEVDEQGFALEWYDSFSGGIMLPMDTLLEDGVSYYATLYDAASGCESLMRLEVVPTVIPCEVVIYNAISLNDNGMNDYMVIENAEYFPDNSLEVYNRDGHLLYSQTQYGIGDNLFRGIANVSGIYGSTLSGDGPRLPTGSYIYVFKYFNPYEQQEYTLKGFLTINSN